MRVYSNLKSILFLDRFERFYTLQETRLFRMISVRKITIYVWKSPFLIKLLTKKVSLQKCCWKQFLMQNSLHWKIFDKIYGENVCQKISNGIFDKFSLYLAVFLNFLYFTLFYIYCKIY